MAIDTPSTPSPAVPKAPDSPRVKTWNRRIASWGCAPMMIAGLVAGFVPAMREPFTILGTGLVLLVGIPVTAYAYWLRRQNQARYRQAFVEAHAKGLKVRVVTTDAGDHEYRLEEPEPIEPLPWALEHGAPADPAAPGGPPPTP